MLHMVDSKIGGTGGSGVQSTGDQNVGSINNKQISNSVDSSFVGQTSNNIPQEKHLALRELEVLDQSQDSNIQGQNHIQQTQGTTFCNNNKTTDNNDAKIFTVKMKEDIALAIKEIEEGKVGNGGHMSNIFLGLTNEQIGRLGGEEVLKKLQNALKPSEVAKKSEALIKNMNENLKKAVEGFNKAPEDPEKEKYAKLVGKYAGSINRFVPGSTMGALKGDIKVGKRIRYELKQISDIGKDFGKIKKAIEEKKVDEITRFEKDIRNFENFCENFGSEKKIDITYEKDNGGSEEKIDLKEYLSKTMPDLAKKSFNIENAENYSEKDIDMLAVDLAVKNCAIDARIVQFIATPIDLMESIDDFSKKEENGKKISLSSEGYNPKPGFETTLKNGFSDLGKILGWNLKEGDNGYECAKNTRIHMKNVRESSMFAEFKYPTLNENLAKKFAENLSFDKEEERNLAEKQILKNIEKKCSEIFKEDNFGDIEYPKAGERGRTANTAKKSNDKDSKDSGEHGPVTSRKFKTLKEDNKELKSFIDKRIENEEFKQEATPQRTANSDIIDKDYLEQIINNPVDLLKDVEVSKIENTKETMLEGILNVKTGYNEQTLKSVIEKNDDGSYISKKTFSDAIFENNLRTICGPSGTTTDIGVGLHLMLGKKAMNVILGPFGKLIENEKSKSIVEKLSANKEYNGAKSIFWPIADYMQSPGYHSSGEVGGGLYTYSLNCEDNASKAREDTGKYREDLGVLCDVLAKNPEAFKIKYDDDA